MNNKQKWLRTASHMAMVDQVMFLWFAIPATDAHDREQYRLYLQKLVPLHKTIRFNAIAQDTLVASKNPAELEYREHETARLGFFSISGQLPFETGYGASIAPVTMQSSTGLLSNLIKANMAVLPNSRARILDAFWRLKYAKDRKVAFLDKLKKTLFVMHLHSFTLENHNFNFTQGNVWKVTIQFADYKRQLNTKKDPR